LDNATRVLSARRTSDCDGPQPVSAAQPPARSGFLLAVWEGLKKWSLFERGKLNVCLSVTYMNWCNTQSARLSSFHQKNSRLISFHQENSGPGLALC